MARQNRSLAPAALQQRERPGRSRVGERSNRNILSVTLEKPPPYEIATAVFGDDLPPYDYDVPPPEYYITEFSWSRYHPITQPPDVSGRAASAEAARAHLENRVLAADSTISSTTMNRQDEDLQNGHAELGTRGAAYLNIFADDIASAGLSVHPDVSTWPRRQNRPARTVWRYVIHKILDARQRARQHARCQARHYAHLGEFPLDGTESLLPQTSERRNAQEFIRGRL